MNRHCLGIRSVTLLLVGVLLTGCVTRRHDSYPTAWPPLRKGDCDSLLATYENRSGESSDPSWQPALLQLLDFQAVEGRQWKKDRPGRVTLSMPTAGVLEARGSMDYLRFVASEREFICRGAALELSRSYGTGILGGTGRGSMTLSLFRDVEGSLIVRQHRREFGLWVAIPVYWSRTTWYRFPAVSDKP